VIPIPVQLSSGRVHVHGSHVGSVISAELAAAMTSPQNTDIYRGVTGHAIRFVTPVGRLSTPVCRPASSTECGPMVGVMVKLHGGGENEIFRLDARYERGF